MLRFLSDYRTAFTTRADRSTWPKNERTWLNAGRYFRGLLRPGSPNTVTDIAEKMHIDQERLERFVCESPWEHESVETELRERVPEAIQGHQAVSTDSLHPLCEQTAVQDSRVPSCIPV